MPYVVTYKDPKGKELSLDQVLSCENDVNQKHKERRYPGSVTRFYDTLPEGLFPTAEINRLINKLESLGSIRWNGRNNLKTYYKFFEIPKRSGGMREIAAPDWILSNYQIELRDLFEKEFNVHSHTTAFAYCKGRNTKFCIERHQANESKWFLKLDFSDFFGNTNKIFVLKQLNKIAPFSEIMKTERGKKALSKAIDICFLDNKLPQGTPISPMLTNIVMIPIDHELNKRFHEMKFVYTRYADDMQISSKCNFDYNKVINMVNEVLKTFEAPYTIKNKKTRYGSSSGRNWNLGLMLNKDNNITIGHLNHKIMKAKMNSFILDEKNRNHWSLEGVEKLNGQLEYFRSIEPEYASYLKYHYNEKYHINFDKLIKDRIKAQTKAEICARIDSRIFEAQL